MATLREMLVKIYQPTRGLIDFGDGPPATQDGAPALGVLGGGAGDDGGEEGGMGAITLPGLRAPGLGGGGAPDTGAPGLGDGFGEVFQDPNQLRQLLEGFERGGQSGEAGGFAGEGTTPGIDGYTNLDSPFGTLLDIVGAVGPGPIGWVAAAAKAGIRAGNLDRIDQQLKDAGFERGLSGWQELGGIAGVNNYAEGSWAGNLAASAAAQRSARDGEQGFRSTSATGETYRTSPSGPTQRTKSSSSYRGNDRGADRGFGGPSDRGGRSAGASGGGFRGGDENAA